jgi:hypothetical protein
MRTCTWRTQLSKNFVAKLIESKNESVWDKWTTIFIDHLHVYLYMHNRCKEEEPTRWFSTSVPVQHHFLLVKLLFQWAHGSLLGCRIYHCIWDPLFIIVNTNPLYFVFLTLPPWIVDAQPSRIFLQNPSGNIEGSNLVMLWKTPAIRWDKLGETPQTYFMSLISLYKNLMGKIRDRHILVCTLPCQKHFMRNCYKTHKGKKVECDGSLFIEVLPLNLANLYFSLYQCLWHTYKILPKVMTLWINLHDYHKILFAGYQYPHSLEVDVSTIILEKYVLVQLVFMYPVCI